MKKMAIAIASIIAVIGISFIGLIIFFSIAFSMPSKAKVVKEFNKNEADLFKLVQFFEACDYESLWIDYWNKKVNASSMDKLEDRSGYVGEVILDEDTIKLVTDLFKEYNYQVIAKQKNYVMFQRGGNIRYGVGVLYLIEGDEPESIDTQFIELEELSSSSWYYYVEQ